LSASGLRPSTRQELLALLRADIADSRVLDAIAGVRRDLFVPPALRRQAWWNSPLPIGSGQTISQPLIVARMCEALELCGDEHVLDVGSGSGYHAAVLSRLCRSVVSIERDPVLSAQARRNLAAAEIENVTLVLGDGSQGHPEQGPYDAINVAAAAFGQLPRALLGQLSRGGRLVAPLDRGAQRLILAKLTDSGVEISDLGPVRFVPLTGPRDSDIPR
jgi:protein-L-isoaspartate(D-aspartate) O-methyltransferase